MPRRKPNNLEALYPSSVSCPACNAPKVYVIDSRHTASVKYVDCEGTRRRRACLMCDHRFTTYEITAANMKKFANTHNTISKRRLMVLVKDITAQIERM